MDVSRYAVSAEDIDALSTCQIANFFRRHKSITKDDCNRTAADIIGGSVSPTLVQGETSYTVAADTNQQPKAVQFRHSALNLELMNQARQTYGEFVPNCKPCRMLADVHVYEMDLVPGPWGRLFSSPAFFASAWNNRPVLQQPLDNASELFSHYSRIIDQLSHGLPERFHPALEEVRQGLPLLFRSDYPMVLNHDDLLEMNIHVDEGTGRITGIVDWAEAKIAPFGTSLWGLETILGVRTSSCWIDHPRRHYLQMQFWKAFYGLTGDISDTDRQAIEVGRMFGLFRAYGFDRRPEKEDATPLSEGDQELVYLEAFCLRHTNPPSLGRE